MWNNLMSKFTIVITTINLPKLLGDLALNIASHDRANDTTILVIGDRKTPRELPVYMHELAHYGVPMEYWGIPEQEKWLAQHPELAKIIPYDTDNRRNIGHLLAYERSDEVTIALDDDNYPAAQSDYLEGFSGVGDRRQRNHIGTDSGWYNVCDLLAVTPDVTIYPRGYPVSKRWIAQKSKASESSSRLVVQAGLWNGVPDIDAATHVSVNVTTKAVAGRNIALANGTWCPFNTQNTAFLTEITPAFYYVAMRDHIKGQAVDRYGDIWASYFARKVIDAMGEDCVGFGDPAINHIRNEHNALMDLQLETPAMVLNELLLELLGEIDVAGGSYQEAAECMVDEFASCVERLVRDDDYRRYLGKIAGYFAVWVRTCAELRR
jgi:reversibly glycosylated polypeptide